MTDKENELDKDPKPPTILQVIGSVLSAFIGIQNSKNKKRDFEGGNIKVFIAVGIILTFTFLISVYLVVQLVIPK